MPKVAIHTLGCKVNQYESEKLASEFRSNGFDVVDFRDVADIYVINSCTVTGSADSKSRQAARGAAQRNPNAKVVLTGCYAERTSEEIDGIALIVGNRDKARLVQIVRKEFGLTQSGDVVIGTTLVASRTRALLKIQDGCDQFCSYCAVPFARSEMWSKEFSSVMNEAALLRDSGYKEIVLTGIRVGRYSDAGKDLADVLEGIAAIDGIERVRLSSIELTDIPSRLVEIMAGNRKLCRHLHIPLQSGDDRTLERMHRPYSTSDFRKFAVGARQAVEGLAITTDIMVGFPGETGDDFESSLSFAREMEFSRAHVFRYSPRPGTAAAEIGDTVSGSEKETRSTALIGCTKASADRFAKSLIGESMAVLVEGKEIQGGKRSGLTDNYVRVVFPGDQSLAGSMVQVRITDVSEGNACGFIEEVRPVAK